MKPRKWHIFTTASMLTIAVSITSVTAWYTQRTDDLNMLAATSAINSFSTIIADGDIPSVNETTANDTDVDTPDSGD